jgi:hypothetical protein
MRFLGKEIRFGKDDSDEFNVEKIEISTTLQFIVFEGNKSTITLEFMAAFNAVLTNELQVDVSRTQLNTIGGLCRRIATTIESIQLEHPKGFTQGQLKKLLCRIIDAQADSAGTAPELQLTGNGTQDIESLYKFGIPEQAAHLRQRYGTTELVNLLIDQIIIARQR